MADAIAENRTASKGLDAKYDKQFLSLIRTHLHREIVSKHCLLTRSEYAIYFDDEALNDIEYVAGHPIQIIINASPYDGTRVSRLLNQAMKNPTIFKQLRRSMQVVRQSDAMLWFRVELEQIDEYARKHAEETNSLRYQTDIVATWSIVRVKDTQTGKAVKLTIKNGDAFTATERAIAILRQL